MESRSWGRLLLGRLGRESLDTIVVPVPTREWALVAIEDLRRECLTADLEGQDADGFWLVKIEGPAGSIAEIRYALHAPGRAFNWEALLNPTVGEDRP